MMANPPALESSQTVIAGASLETATLWRLYLEMLRIRVIELSIAQRYSEKEMRCPVHLSVGQEAVGVGVCAH
ncbi:MAG TPA: hypothetical protein VN673_17905, partial [Clostridia bacterium]|nr:hypothetical protein [Clostridia bacterium]